MKTMLQKYKHAILMLGYACIYVPWFIYLEKNITSHYHVIHMKIDDYIPFNELFIIPYLLWFAYVFAVLLYLLWKDKGDYYKMCGFLFTGMTVFLIISTIFPNGHHLRPVVFERDNIFTAMVAALYRTDTPTNLFPSIHVYNSISAHIAILCNERLKKNKWLTVSSSILCVSIILSTVFLKQHSVFDMLTAFAMAGIMYPLVYKVDYTALRERYKKPLSRWI